MKLKLDVTVIMKAVQLHIDAAIDGDEIFRR